MNAQQIRATKFSHDDGAWECAHWLQEIAAQLAESNAAASGERQNAQRFRERIGVLQENLQSTFSEMVAPVAPPPRIVAPGEIVHLGCILREPDGTHAIASALDGQVHKLEPEEAQRLLALFTINPAESKPS